ncbi:polyprenyl synthetase family protein [Methanopyrus sp.]
MHDRVLEELERAGELVDDKIREVLPRGGAAELYDACWHLIEAGGKRFRPLLAIKSCQALGGAPEDVLPEAAAVELIHTFTLIHDDIMDEDEERRGVEAVHVRWNVPVAILAGDTLFSKAFEVAAEGGDIRAVRELARACTEICEGQAMDLEFEERDDVTEEEFLEMVRKKTAALIRASCVVGGLKAGADDDQLTALAEYGENLGIAFQIQDDVLDLVGDESKLGKPVGSDIVEGKKTLIVIKGLERADEGQRERILSVLGNEDASREEVLEVIEILRELGAIDYARERAREYAEAAKEALSRLPGNEHREFLEAVADFVVEREF